MSNPYEPKHSYIRQIAGYTEDSDHHKVVSMGVLSELLPSWDDIQIIPSQLAPRKPLLDVMDTEDQHKVKKHAYELVGTDVTIGSGPHALKLEIPLIISDMSFGSLSEIAKMTLAKGAEKAGTAICSGEGGILRREAQSNSRFMVQIGTAKFGYENFKKYKEQIKSIHFKGGQAAKTGTGGLLPKEKLTKKIREARGLPADYNSDVHSPATYSHCSSVSDFKAWIYEIRNSVVGKYIPIGFKLSANHIESDIQFALDTGVDYIILDGRGGATGAAPSIFRDHISIPTIPALARARKYLDSKGFKKGGNVKLIITGGIRVPTDFVKALALGADAIALSNSALQAIGCIATRKCYNNKCPAGIATQDDARTQPLIKKEQEQGEETKPSTRLLNFFTNSLKEMRILSAACGHTHLNQLNIDDLATFNRELTYLAGVPYAGLST